TSLFRCNHVGAVRVVSVLRNLLGYQVDLTVFIGGNNPFSPGYVEYRILAQILRIGRRQIIAKTKIQGEVAAYLPIILEEYWIIKDSLAKQIPWEISVSLIRRPYQKVREGVAAVLAIERKPA